METLIEQYLSLVENTHTDFKRNIINEIDWNYRLTALTGARGVGKTTLLLQYIKENLSAQADKTLYVSLDNLFFSKTNLVELAGNFAKREGKYLFLDEVHKYPDWSIEIKNIYDNFPQLQVVFTGSSSLEIFKGQADLSRRAVVYKLTGLSFREFLEMKYKIVFKPYSLDEILNNSLDISREINALIRPIKYFEEYISKGYYPFFTEGENHYHQRIEQTIIQIIENDLVSIENIDFNSAIKLRKLLVIMAELVPYKPNILKLSQQIGISRDTLLKYLYWLQRADLMLLLESDKEGIIQLNKPDKVYLNNPNLAYALNGNKINIGSIRETFFFNQLKVKHKVNYTEVGDFLIDEKYIFEIGGKHKTRKQIAGLENSFIAADNIEYPYKNTIPIWMFGFLY